MKKIYTIIFLLLVLSVYSIYLQPSEENSFTLYQLADISEIRPQDGIKYSNVLPTVYLLNQNGITSRILNYSKNYTNCIIEDIYNWRCNEGNWVFGVQNRIYFSNAMPEDHVVVSRLEYSLNWCRWYFKESLLHFVTKCPLNLIFGP